MYMRQLRIDGDAAVALALGRAYAIDVECDDAHGENTGQRRDFTGYRARGSPLNRRPRCASRTLYNSRRSHGCLLLRLSTAIPGVCTGTGRAALWSVRQ